MKNILIFPCGADNAIELYDSLRFSTHFDVYGATSQDDRSDLIYPSDRLLRLPFIYDESFVRELNACIAKNNIDMIFATHDTVLLELVRKRPEINAIVIGCDEYTAELCRYKDRLYEFLAVEDFIPEWAEAVPVPFAPPYFEKPVDGQGGQNCRRLDKHPSSVPSGHIICEYLPGSEYTVDCFTDRHGELLFASPRTRDIVKMGIAFKSRRAYSPKSRRMAEALNERLKFRGLWFFQVKEDGKGDPKLLEISSRISTTMGLFRMQGVNLPLMTAYDALDHDVHVLGQDFLIESERVLRAIYRTDLRYSRIYVDYDDTLVIRGRVNEELIRFLYQSLNDGKELILLTRHEGDMEAELDARRICGGMFTEIIHLPPGGDKMAFLKPDSIYIDNMFHDREKAAAMGVPVFDVDAVPCLACSGRDGGEERAGKRFIRCDLLVPADPVKDLVDQYSDEEDRKKFAAIVQHMKEKLVSKGYGL